MHWKVNMAVVEIERRSTKVKRSKERQRGESRMIMGVAFFFFFVWFLQRTCLHMKILGLYKEMENA